MIALKDSQDSDDQLNILSTYGALFFGVPGFGMDVKAMAAMVQNLPAQNTMALLDQRFGFRARNRQHERFCKAFDYPTSKIVQFLETKKSPTVQQASFLFPNGYCSHANRFRRILLQKYGLWLARPHYLSVQIRQPAGEIGKREGISSFLSLKIIHVWEVLAWSDAKVIERTQERSSGSLRLGGGRKRKQLRVLCAWLVGSF